MSTKSTPTPNQEADFRTAILKGNTPGIRASIMLDMVQQRYNKAISAGPDAITAWNGQLTTMRANLCNWVAEGAGTGEGTGNAMGLGSRGAGAGGTGNKTGD